MIDDWLSYSERAQRILDTATVPLRREQAVEQMSLWEWYDSQRTDEGSLLRGATDFIIYMLQAAKFLFTSRLSVL